MVSIAKRPIENRLLLHCGGEVVDLEAVESVRTPEPEGKHYPIAHTEIIEETRKAVTNMGLQVTTERHAISREGARYFGLLGVGNPDSELGYDWVVGMRNTHDKSFAASVAMGTSVWACDNLAFSGEVVLARKHTRFIARDLNGVVMRAVGKLNQMKVDTETRYAAYHDREIKDSEVYELVVRGLLAKAYGANSIHPILEAWKEPEHEEFADRNLWSLFNCMTGQFRGSSDPSRMINRSAALHGVCDSFAQLSFSNN
jgi:hypothetical protein